LVKRTVGRRIFYADYATQDALRTKSAADPNVDCSAIPHIDYVVASIADYGQITERFDYILASHVIEHTPDFLGWLKTLLVLLKPEGRLILAIPDRRYMFDYFRAESTLGDALEAFYEQRSRPTFRQVFDGHGGARKIDIISIWDGRPPKPTERYFDMHTVLNLAQSAAGGAYSDCHCWVFTHPSFLNLLSCAGELGVLTCRVIGDSAPVKYSNEFHIILSN